MRVCVVIIGFRNPADILACLGGLAASTHRDFSMTIRENGGEEAHAALAAALPARLPHGQAVNLLRGCDNRGFAGGVNDCIRASPAEAWWILNPDARPEPQALAALVERLGRGDVQAVGGPLYLPDGSVQAYGGRWRPALARAVSIGHGLPRSHAVAADMVEAVMNYIPGASALVHRDFLARAGLMREDYFLYGEEVEWFLRARRLGLRLGFAPQGRVLHDQGATTGSGKALRERNRLPIYLDERNKLNIVRDSTPWLLPIAIPAALVLGLGRFLRRGAFAQQRHALAGWAAGIRGERGPIAP